MKTKRVVLAAALAVASSAFAEIFPEGDVYGSWFVTNAVSEAGIIDHTLDAPLYVHNGVLAQSYDGYVVTADVEIVIHAELPDVPPDIETSVHPKGAICAVETNNTSLVTNWYGLAGGRWVALTVPATPTEALHHLVMEFKDKDGAQKVRYTIDGNTCSTNTVEWLDAGHGDAPRAVAFAGSGVWSYVKGLTVNAKVTPSAVSYSWKEGFEFTNGTVAVTLDGSYDFASMGEVNLIVTGSDGSVEKRGATQGNTGIAVTPTLVAGQKYTYAIETVVNGVASTNVLGSFVSAASGSFGASVTNTTVAAVFGGDWDGGAPTTASSAYSIAGSEVFDIDGDCDGLTIVDSAVTFTTWGDANDMVNFNDSTFAAITVVTNVPSGTPIWKAFAYTGDGYEWVNLVGGFVPELNKEYDVRAVFDFGATPKAVSYSVKAAASSEYIPFTYADSAWLRIGDDKSALREVGYIGIGKLNNLVGGNSDTNLAAIGGTSYATLADAMAAMTNGNNVITLRTSTYWPTNLTAAGTYTILTNGFVLAGISGSGITQTENGYTITFSTGVCAVDGGALKLSTAALTELIKADAATKTPAEISAALNEKQANGIETWVNYVLGIDGTDSTKKPFAAPVQNADQDKLTFKLGGVNVNDSVEGVSVSYKVEELDSPSAVSGTPHEPENGEVKVDAPTGGVKYYRVKVSIEIPN